MDNGFEDRESLERGEEVEREEGSDYSRRMERRQQT